MSVKNALHHFIHFHKGSVNIVLHIIGFVGIFYSVWKLDWVLFGVSFILVEMGHILNHFKGIVKYDIRIRVFFWRLSIFLVVLTAFFISKILKG